MQRCIFGISGLLVFLYKTGCLGRSIERGAFILPPNWDLDDGYALTNFACGESILCNNSLSAYKCPLEKWKCSKCSCDINCVRYGTCCLDVLSSIGKIPRVLYKVGCVSPVYKPSIHIVPRNFSMVTGCLYNSDIQAKNLCENNNPFDVVQNTPVQGVVDGTEMTFKNRHCAECCGLTQNNIKPWIMDYQCSGLLDYSNVRSIEEYKKFVETSDYCAILMKPEEESTVVPCGVADSELAKETITQNMSTCLNAKGKLKLACDNLYLPIIVQTLHNKIHMKNIFCGVCNELPIYRNDNYCEPLGRVFDTIVPLSSLFDAGKRQVIINKTEEKIYCKEYEVYDDLHRYCRPIWCPIGMLVHNHSCKDIAPSSHGVAYRLYYTLSPTMGQKIPLRQFSELLFITHYYDYLRRYLSVINPAFVDITFRHKHLVTLGIARIKQVVIYIKVIIGKHYPRRIIEQKLDYLQNSPFYWYINDDIPSEEIFLPQPVLVDESLHSPISDWKDEITANGDNIKISKERYFEQFIAHEQYTMSDNNYVLVNNLLSCPMILLNESEYTLSNNSLYIIPSAKLINPGQFRLHTNSIYVCSKYEGYRIKKTISKFVHIFFEFSHGEIILTVVCVSLSLAGLFLTLCVYILLPHLRTFPGKLNMALFSSIFVAYLFFLTTMKADVSKLTCKVFGAMNHYFLLTMFCWKSVCAFHMFRVFRYPFKIIEQKKWFLIYALYCHIIPLIIVAIYILIHLRYNNWENVGYGGDVCYLNTELGMWLGFVLPVAIILSANMVFFIIILIIIYRSNKQMNKTHVFNTAVYFRISVILGLTWFLGFIALVNKNKVLQYVFTVLNSLAGLFIFSSYVLKRDVLNNLSRKFGIKVKSESASSNNYNSSGDSTVNTLTAKSNSYVTHF